MSEKKGKPKGSRGPIERRKFIRIVEGCAVTFAARDEAKGEGTLFDLSLRGLRFLSATPLLNGEKIRVAFTLSNGISMDLAGVIRHTHQRKMKKWIYGIEFFIREYRDLKEHIKLNGYILRARAEQDQMLQEEVLKRKHL